MEGLELLQDAAAVCRDLGMLVHSHGMVALGMAAVGVGFWELCLVR